MHGIFNFAPDGTAELPVPVAGRWAAHVLLKSFGTTGAGKDYEQAGKKVVCSVVLQYHASTSGCDAPHSGVATAIPSRRIVL